MSPIARNSTASWTRTNIRFLIDTNILIYAADRRCAEHPAALDFLQGAAEGSIPWCLAWPVLYEFVRVCTNPRTLTDPVSAPQAMDFIHRMLESDSLTLLTPTGRHEAVLRQTVGELAAPRGRFFYDIQIAVLMREHGVGEIITADTDFHQFKFLKVTDPVHRGTG